MLKALSKSRAFSEASTSRAISTKRLCRSASLSLGKRFVVGFCFAAIPHNVSSSKGNSSCAGCGSRRFPRHCLGRLGRLRSPLATSRFVSEALAARSFNRQIGALHVVNTELDPIGVPEIELVQVAVQMGF